MFDLQLVESAGVPYRSFPRDETTTTPGKQNDYNRQLDFRIVTWTPLIKILEER